ncbi:hypothetical protein GCM10023195_83170 [Actinoallomurus liliacearum]|uniref:Uncharacterized protein n=1 Tax=Actinoallomurus liliacearum TaxID=1080073 RepID=A0ABP8TYT1_9ACTN
MKIIDRVKTYIREKKGRDPRSTDDPLGGAADPAPAQRDRAGHKQNRDDKKLAVSTAHEAPEPEPATESAAEPVIEPAAEPAAESVIEPAAEPAAESVIEPAAESVIEPAAESVIEPAAESAVEPVTEPAVESVIEPAAESAAEPAAEPAAESATAPAACPRCGATGEAPCTTPSGKATKTHKGREQ